MKNFILILSLVLTACGSGGGSDSDPVVGDVSVSKCSLGPDLIKIMPIGDSITEAERGHNSYRRALWSNLKATGCNFDFVGSKNGVKGGAPLNGDFDADHEGYWGYRVDQILPFIGSKFAEHKPDIALIHLGTNDTFQGQSVQSTIEEISLMIDQIRTQKADVNIFLAQVIPSRKANDQLGLLNQEIFKLGVRKNTEESPIVVVDQNSGYEVSNNYDGTHPAGIGEVKIADRWTNAILSSTSISK